MRWWLRARTKAVWPPVGLVRFGSLRRLTPVSRDYGNDRGLSIARFYIEDFLRRHATIHNYSSGIIRGHVLEVGEDVYVRKFGGWKAQVTATNGQRTGVTKVDILHLDDSNPLATIVADLTAADHLPSDVYDCIICTQTLYFIYDVRAAIRTLHRILKPGGTLLATFPGTSRVGRPPIDLETDYWRFTTRSARRLLEEAFDASDVTVEAYGNVLTASAYLYGLATEDLKREELHLRDPDYEVIVAVRAMKR